MSYADGTALVRVSTSLSVSSSAVDAFHMRGGSSWRTTTQIDKSSLETLSSNLPDSSDHTVIFTPQSSVLVTNVAFYPDGL